MKNALSYHLPRLLHQFGQPVKFGKNQFKMAGYFPCRFTTYSDQHERFLGVILRRVLETRSGAFIDVGVNAGQTLAKVLSIDKERLYLGFEPQLSCCFNADQFIKANELLNAKVLPIALSDNNHLLSFFRWRNRRVCQPDRSGRYFRQPSEDLCSMPNTRRSIEGDEHHSNLSHQDRRRGRRAPSHGRLEKRLDFSATTRHL